MEYQTDQSILRPPRGPAPPASYTGPVAEPVPVRGLFETHLTVRDVERSVTFYRDVVGLPLALDLPERNAAFMWVGDRGRSMLGLWGIGSSVNSLTLHIAFEVALEAIL